jgi:sulfotransferase
MSPICVGIYGTCNLIQKGGEMKTINFLTGLPRSGNTVLSAILNQNPRFYSSPLSPVCDVAWSVVRTLNSHESAQRNPNKLALNTSVKAMAHGYYETVDRPIIFDRAKAWTTPSNFLVLKTINPSPKVLFTVRDTCDILSSLILQYRKTTFLEKRMEETNFYAQHFLPLEDAKCDFLMDSQQDLQLSFLALKNALKEENKQFVHFIEYDDLVTNTHRVLEGVYKFLEEDYYEHDLTSISKLESDTGLQGKEPSTLHDVRKTMGKTSLKPEEVLSPYVLNKYKDYDNWRKNL